MNELFSWFLTMIFCKFVFMALHVDFTVSNILVASLVWLMIRACYALKDFKETHKNNTTDNKKEIDNCQDIENIEKK